MSKILSYNKKTTGEGWITLTNQYSADEISMINDPNGGLSVKPRTAIPSPFAQMDLVKNAFRRLALSPILQGEVMDERLVSHALDVAQLFFNLPELGRQVRVVEWSRQQALATLRQDPAHCLLADTLEMYMEQDKEAFNFEQMDRLYFLLLGSEVVGCTSPVTLYMATPNAQLNHNNPNIEQNVGLFEKIRPLHERTDKFVKMLYALFTAYPQLKRLCGEVNSYLITSFNQLKPEVKSEIISQVGDPKSMDLDRQNVALQYLHTHYSLMEPAVQILSVPCYCVRQTDIEQAINESDFRILPSVEVARGERLPLVLQNHLYAQQTEKYQYITAPWDDRTIIQPKDWAPEPDKRVLPATTHQYPWLTVDDFLQPTLIKLDYTQDRDCFFDGNLSIGSLETDDADFLLPIKPLFFRYFTPNDLMGTIGGKPKMEIIHTRQGEQETVRVLLRIPVQRKGGWITLERLYVATHQTDLGYDLTNDHGYFVTLPFSLSVFPFATSPLLRFHHVQLVDRALGLFDNHSLSLRFHHAAQGQYVEQEQLCRQRSLKAEKRVGSSYYRVEGFFDTITVSLMDERGKVAAEGVVCPRWPQPADGHEAFTFAVDFGTTNTHVECMRQGQLPEPLELNSQAQKRLVATLYNGRNILYDVLMRQEFLPEVLGQDYGFPQRTVLSEPERLDTENIDQIVALGDANIPFIYEKESIGYGNRIVPNLKWSTEMATAKRVRAYITELALLMRTKVLLEHGDLSKTRVVWFYPLSMKIGNIRKMGEMWAKTFQEVFGIVPDDRCLIQMPESVAPYYFYRQSSHFRGAASTVASIDIGGGTSDVAVFGSNSEQPLLLSSFRFAANALFGDGFSEIPHGDTNPMVTKYVDYFRRLFEADDDRYGELTGILEDITAKRKSEDINAFLFSVMKNKVVAGNDVFSYNLRLNEDGRFKLIFIYFFATLIYHVARTMHHREIAMPRSLMFSGTGSKVLDIVGVQSDLEIIAQAIFEYVYGQHYEEGGFSIVMERREPKQITCRGALMQVRDSNGYAELVQLNKLMEGLTSQLRYNYTGIAQETLTYADMEQPTVCSLLVEEVQRWNDFFLTLCDKIEVVDRFLVDQQSLTHFREWVNRDLEHHLINGWKFVNKNEPERNANDKIEDTVFFYPIIGAIRENLIEHC